MGMPWTIIQTRKKYEKGLQEKNITGSTACTNACTYAADVQKLVVLVFGALEWHLGLLEGHVESDSVAVALGVGDHAVACEQQGAKLCLKAEDRGAVSAACLWASMCGASAKQ